MLIGSDKIREIVERSDLLQIIGKYVQLRRVGRSWVGLCPFHGERTPSFYVSPQRHSYKCFGCQRGGDVIRFVMEYEGKDFPTAARELAELAGVRIVEDPEENRRIRARRELLWACQVAERFFQETLWSERGAQARRHLAERRISEEVAREAGLGYAPAGWTELRDHLAREKVPQERAVEAGLLGAKDGRAFDIFRGRLMIPIRDAEKRVIAFGGRILEGDDPRKYINSRETPLYTKSRVLYGLDTARDAIRSAREAVLVEGYFDALALRQAGIPNVVALCSTVLTPDHLRLLERLGVEQIHLLLDGDEAGREGVMRVAGVLLAAGLSAKVLELPDGTDPDTFLDKEGRAGYQRLVDQAPALSRYVVRRAQAKGVSTYEEKLASLGALRPILAQLPDGAQRALFLTEVAQQFGLPPAAVAEHFGGNRQAQEKKQEARPGPRPASDRPPPRRELELVARLFARPELQAGFGAELTGKLSHPALREAVGLLCAEGGSSEEILAGMDPALAQALEARARSILRQPPGDWEQEMRDGLLHLELERLQEERRASIAEREALERELAAAGDGAAQEELSEALRACSERAALLRVEMERLRVSLRGGAG